MPEVGGHDLIAIDLARGRRELDDTAACTGKPECCPSGYPFADIDSFVLAANG
jgi:hypothetical protein